MALETLNHYSVRTTDLESSRRFYVEVLGLKEGERPPFPFPGHWLYCGGQPVVHLIGIDPEDSSGLANYLGDRSAGRPAGRPADTGAVDHIAFLASDLASMRQRLAVLNIPCRERTVPLLGQHQIFLTDPDGVTVEINFPAAEAEMPAGR